jgi:hypothetical protein
VIGAKVQLGKGAKVQDESFKYESPKGERYKMKATKFKCKPTKVKEGQK